MTDPNKNTPVLISFLVFFFFFKVGVETVKPSNGTYQLRVKWASFKCPKNQLDLSFWYLGYV